MKKVIVIGAGPAGITAALELLRDNGKENYEVIILEESNEIGGISRTVRYNGNRMDIGGHRFFSKNDRVNDFWLNLLPLQGADSFDDKLLGRNKPLNDGGPDPEKEDLVMLYRERVSRIYYNKHFFDYPISMKWQTFRNMGFAATVRAGFSYLWAAAFKREEKSLEDFYINRFGKVLYSMFFEGYTEKLWGRHPSEISADWGAQRVKGLSIRALIKDIFSKIFGKKKNSKTVETSLIEQYWYPKFGPGQLWEAAADECVRLGGKVIKSCKVKRLVCEGSLIRSVICDRGGKEVSFDGDIFISTMPVKDLILGIDGERPSEELRAVAENLPYRDFVTVGLLVNKLNLKNGTSLKTLGNIVPDCWIYVQERSVKLGRIQIFNNWSPYMVKDPENTVWLGLEYFCAEGDEFWSLSDSECIEFAVNELISMGIIDSDSVLDAHRERVRKAYPAYFDSYKDFAKLREYLDTLPNLYCVGRNGQHRYNNMDHSMLTAMLAADGIKNGEANKSPIWEVNTEKNYHEEKEVSTENDC